MGFKPEATLNTLQYEMVQGGFLYEFHAFRLLLSVRWFVLISSVRHNTYGISWWGWFCVLDWFSHKCCMAAKKFACK
jgi:hypothetical protein